MKVRSYNPHMLELLRLGTTREFRVKQPSLRSVRHLRAKLNNLRASMRKENHELSHIVESVQLSIEAGETPEHPAVLFVHSNDDQFIEAIRAAGVKIPLAPDLDADLAPAPAAPLPPQAEASASEETVRRYFEATED